ncbi:hypothetical protein GDO81_024210 [Engystomops pustulosus]|uniref:Uncharacterized protein n=1 Tax=Engystomops pustulosus TaxID=76066 RepID=A0AAV6YKZ0_ENGPU|nr:hypothetical protein GDO81_024210 [Engystomops pustulosus]
MNSLITNPTKLWDPGDQRGIHIEVGCKFSGPVVKISSSGTKEKQYEDQCPPAITDGTRCLVSLFLSRLEVRDQSDTKKCSVRKH